MKITIDGQGMKISAETSKDWGVVAEGLEAMAKEMAKYAEEADEVPVGVKGRGEIRERIRSGLRDCGVHEDDIEFMTEHIIEKIFEVEEVKVGGTE